MHLSENGMDDAFALKAEARIYFTSPGGMEG